LVDMNMALELSFGSGQDRFDGNPQPHYHFRCRNCGRVSDLPLPVKHELDAEAAKYFPGKIQGHRLEFFGYCTECEQEMDSQY
jgi:Fur family peroxide stress response transcriptional regulator